VTDAKCQAPPKRGYDSDDYSGRWWPDLNNLTPGSVGTNVTVTAAIRQGVSKYWWLCVTGQPGAREEDENDSHSHSHRVGGGAWRDRKRPFSVLGDNKRD